MDTTSLIISIFSLIVAAIAIGWNIYRDVVLKPRVKVSIAKSRLVREGMGTQNNLVISAVNFGPGKVHLEMINFMHRTFAARIMRKWSGGFLIHDYKNPISGQLPKTLDIGESINMIFSWDSGNICSEAPTHIGIKDSFGRTHWASRKELKKVNDQWAQEFGINQKLVK